jgi:hypothetical protein
MAAGALPLLVKLLRGGSDKGKANAAGALRNLSGSNDANKVAVSAAGAILPLMEWGIRGGEEERRGRGAVQPHASRRRTAPSFRTRLHPQPTRSVYALIHRECTT